MKVAYINLYHSGYFHRAGKPQQFNAHPGDMYPTRAAAEADVHPRDLYIATVPVLLPAAVVDTIGPANPATSQPTDLEVTRAAVNAFGLDGLLSITKGI